MNGLYVRWGLMLMWFVLVSLFGSGCYRTATTHAISSRSGVYAMSVRLANGTVSATEANEFRLGILDFGHQHGACSTGMTFDECREALTSANVYTRAACSLGCRSERVNGRAGEMEALCNEHSIPVQYGNERRFGVELTCARAVHVAVEHLRRERIAAREAARLERDGYNLALREFQHTQEERDRALAALAARQRDAAPTTPTETAPLAGVPDAANRDDAARHADATHGRRHRVGRHRALRNNRPATRDATARRVRERRERSDYVTLAEAQQIATRAVADALHQLNVCADIGMRDARTGIATCMTRVNGCTVVTQALVANQCPSVRPSDVNAMLACGQQIADRLADRADADARASSHATDSGTPPQARATPRPRDPRGPGVGPPSTQQSWGRQWLTRNRGVVLIVVLFIAAIILLRKVLPGTRGPAG